MHRQRCSSIHGRNVRVPKEREARNAEEGVVHICLVVSSVRDATLHTILGVKHEAGDARRVDPVQAAEESERREDPPRVAHIRRFFRAPVQTATGYLPSSQPCAQP